MKTFRLDETRVWICHLRLIIFGISVKIVARAAASFRQTGSLRVALHIHGPPCISTRVFQEWLIEGERACIYCIGFSWNFKRLPFLSQFSSSSHVETLELVEYAQYYFDINIITQLFIRMCSQTFLCIFISCGLLDHKFDKTQMLTTMSTSWWGDMQSYLCKLHLRPVEGGWITHF